MQLILKFIISKCQDQHRGRSQCRTQTRLGESNRQYEATPSVGSINTAGSLLIRAHLTSLPLLAVVSRPDKHWLQLNPRRLPTRRGVLLCLEKGLDMLLAGPPEKPNRTRWQMCHGNDSPCHLFFTASSPNPFPTSTSQSRAE